LKNSIKEIAKTAWQKQAVFNLEIIFFKLEFGEVFRG